MAGMRQMHAELAPESTCAGQAFAALPEQQPGREHLSYLANVLRLRYLLADDCALVPGVTARPPPKLRVWPPRNMALSAVLHLRRQTHSSSCISWFGCTCTLRQPNQQNCRLHDTMIPSHMRGMVSGGQPVAPHDKHGSYVRSKRQSAHPLHPDVGVGPQACLANDGKVAPLPAVSLGVREKPRSHDCTLLYSRHCLFR